MTPQDRLHLVKSIVEAEQAANLLHRLDKLEDTADKVIDIHRIGG
jgi:hypothetical protein